MGRAGVPPPVPSRNTMSYILKRQAILMMAISQEAQRITLPPEEEDEGVRIRGQWRRYRVVSNVTDPVLQPPSDDMYDTFPLEDEETAEEDVQPASPSHSEPLIPHTSPGVVASPPEPSSPQPTAQYGAPVPTRPAAPPTVEYHPAGPTRPTTPPAAQYPPVPARPAAPPTAQYPPEPASATASPDEQYGPPVPTSPATPQTPTAQYPPVPARPTAPTTAQVSHPLRNLPL